MKQLRRDNTGAGPRRCRSPPIVTTVVEGERRSPGSSSWRSSIRELPSLSQAGTGSRTMAPRGWRQRRKALWSGEAIVTNFEGAGKSDRLEKSSIVRGGLPGLGGLFSCNHDDRQGVQESERRGHGSTSSLIRHVFEWDFTTWIVLNYTQMEGNCRGSHSNMAERAAHRNLATCKHATCASMRACARGRIRRLPSQ